MWHDGKWRDREADKQTEMLYMGIVVKETLNLPSFLEFELSFLSLSLCRNTQREAEEAGPVPHPPPVLMCNYELERSSHTQSTQTLMRSPVCCPF